MKFVTKLSLATRLSALVAAVLVLAACLVLQSMRQVRGTEGVLKYTIDNRMVSAQRLGSVADTLQFARDASRSAADREQIAQQVAASHDAWDQYFLADMIEREQALADETTPLLDKAWSSIDKLQERLRAGNPAGLEDFRANELRPAIDRALANLQELSALQIVAAKQDQEHAGAVARESLTQSLLLLGSGLLGALALAWLVIRGVMRQLGGDPSEVAAAAKRIASGEYDFAIRDDVPGSSLLAALGSMQGSLKHSQLDYEGQLAAIGRVQAVVEFTTEGIITDANRNFLRGTGYKLEDIQGKHHAILLDPADRERPEYRGFWPALAAGQSQQGTFRRVSGKGEEFWTRGMYAPIIGKDGKPFKVVAYATDVTAQRRNEQMNAAFRGALEKLGTNVIVADDQFNVIYVNEATRHLIASLQHDLRKDLPNLDALKLVGQSFDNFSPNPVQQRQLLGELSSTHTTEIQLGGHTLRQTMSPMKDEAGRRLGTVIEWVDRTQEIATEIELQDVIGAVTAGDLSRRIGSAGKSGFFSTLSKGINELVDTVGTVVQEVQELVNAANGGDLMRRVRVGGKAGLLVKIGGGINQLTDNMARVVAQVKSAAREVSRGADEISQGTSNLSQRTEQQASSLEETASSMEEMTSTVKQNADNAGQANQLAVAARDQAERGGAVVAKAVKAMSEINDASKKIADIIGVIDEIAFQTNLLALNAAVEAARAGEQGRGFAVVASEVRNLAGRSATAAKEIKALIKDSVHKVDEGSSLVTQSGMTLDQIVAAVKKVTDIVAEIAAASHEQSAGIDQVNKAVMQLDELTQQNAALVEQASAASQAMAEQARGLNERMAHFKVDAARFTQDSDSNTAGASARAPAERRKADRPWTREGKAEGAGAGVVVASPARTGTDDQVWKEF